MLSELLRGAKEILHTEELERQLDSGKRLVVKAGFDPTSPDLHLGHFVVLNKLRLFQDLGHSVKFVVGDFTGLIGDPSGKDATRPPVSKELIEKNAASYAEQAFKVLNPEATEICFNSKWLGALSLSDVLRLASHHTVARMLERDDFSQRYAAGQPIGIHEFLYPLMQGYDSVVLSSDVELGGADQKFNLLVGRHLQKVWKQAPQVVMMMPLLVGLDGTRKMSKSLDNCIGITESPQAMFGKVMSVSDDLMRHYFDLLSFRPSSELDSLKESVAQGANPRDIKMLLASEIVTRFCGDTAAQAAEADFVARFRHGQMPDDIESDTLTIEDSALGLATLLKLSSLTPSTSEAIRMIKQGAVRIDGEKVSDIKLPISAGSEHIFQVGKRRFMKIKLLRGSD